MKYAVIDIGTNSVRLIKADVESGQIVHSEKSIKVTRIGQGVDESKTLSQEGMARTCEAIGHFHQEALKSGYDTLYLMATSAVRDAQNKKVFIEQVKAETGLSIDVISGDLEAEVGFLGVLKGSLKPKETLLVIDIGGGSTEIIVGYEGGIQFAKSFNMGAVRMTDRYTEDGIYTDETIEAIENSVKALVHDHKANILSHQPKMAIGIGGTATSFCTMLYEIVNYSRDKVHNQIISRAAIKGQTQRLIQMTSQERENLIGLDPKRADIISAGGIILYTLLETLEIEELVISDFDNLEGYLFHKIQSI